MSLHKCVLRVEDNSTGMRKIKEMNTGYKLYMRYNGSWDGIVVSEFVTFAVDNEQPDRR